MLYYYDKNYALVNSPSQVVFFISVYLIIPGILAYATIKFVALLGFKENISTLLPPVFNLVTFFVLVVITLFGHDGLKITIAVLLGILIGVVLKNHLRKIVIIQLILSVMVCPKLVPDLYRELVYSKQWMEQSDGITSVYFKKKPNIYFIQPDGYINFKELKNSLHFINNSDFEEYLSSRGFVAYDNYRSNYATTLSSNSALFGMNHHYYGNNRFGVNPSHNRRNEIVGGNPVLEVLRNNGYKTFLMLDVPYLLANRPTIEYDYCNFSMEKISFISRGFGMQRNILTDTKEAILNNKASTNFFFIEAMQPGHIATWKTESKGVKKERELYEKRLRKANLWLTKLIDFIDEEDPNALIIIGADHGSYVGFDYMKSCETRTSDALLITSIFASALAIKWPDDGHRLYDKDLKSSVNLFRVLFSYLGENTSYLKNLGKDNSYIVINDGAPKGVYEYLDDNGTPVFNRLKLE